MVCKLGSVIKNISETTEKINNKKLWEKLLELT
jgi:hypothetical protein